jgi:hypothetical protein
MQEILLESTAVAALGYDASEQILQIRFRDGRAYEYFEVPERTYAELTAASSKGAYFNTAIRGKFRWRERRERREEAATR